MSVGQYTGGQGQGFGTCVYECECGRGVADGLLSEKTHLFHSQYFANLWILFDAILWSLFLYAEFLKICECCFYLRNFLKSVQALFLFAEYFKICAHLVSVCRFFQNLRMPCFYLQNF